MKRFELLVLLSLVALISLAQPPFLQSRVESKTVKSEVLSADREYTVFLPKSYDTDTEKKYPVLYLLHGMMQTNNDWFHRGHVTEFFPHIEKTYKIIGNKQNRAVAGLSMGGGGATAYGQRDSDIFGAVYAMSALMSVPEQGTHRFDDPNSLMAILTRSVIENSCMKYLEEANEQSKEHLLSVC